MSRKKILMLSACSILAIAASACGPLNEQQGYETPAVGSKAETSEDILAAQGSWSMVEEELVSGDPVNLHSSARKQVNPSNRTKRQFIPEERLADIQRGSGEEDVHFRLIRIEREVDDLRQDFKKLLPPLSKVKVADNSLNEAIQEIQARPSRKPEMPAADSAPVYNDTVTSSEALLDSTRRTRAMPLRPIEGAAREPITTAAASDTNVSSASSTYTPATNSLAAAPTTQQPGQSSQATSQVQAAIAGKTVVKDMRFGEHPGKTRLVLDLTGETKFRADIDNTEKLLTIELSEAGWTAASQKLLNHPLVKGYTTQPSGNGGTILALELKKDVKILGSSALKPNAQFGNRIYFDLAAS